MKCIKCGAELGENDVFCPNCGARNLKEGVNSGEVGGYETKPMGATGFEPTNNFEQNINPVQPNATQPMNNYEQQNNFNQPTMPTQPLNNYSQPTENYGNANNFSQPAGNYGNINNFSHGPNNYGANGVNFNNVSTKGTVKERKISIVKLVAIIITAVLAITVLGLGIQIYSTARSGKGRTTERSVGSTGTSSSTTGTTGTANSSSIPTSKTSQNTNNSSTYTVKTGNFVFHVPTDLVYTKINDAGQEAIAVGNQDDTWAAEVTTEQTSYEIIKKNLERYVSALKETAAKRGADVQISDSSVEEIGGVEFIINQYTASGRNSVIALAKLNSMYVAAIEVIDVDNEFNKDVLKEIAPIIKTAEYKDSNSGSSKSIKTDGQLKSEDFDKVLKSIDDKSDEDKNK